MSRQDFRDKQCFNKSINNLDKNVTNTNNLLVEELSKLTNNFSISVKTANDKNINELKKLLMT